MQVNPSPHHSSAARLAVTTAYAKSLVVKAEKGVLYGFGGYNSKASAQWVQVHDAASLPADTAVPKLILYVQATANFSFDAGSFGIPFDNGIVICSSSTGPTKTLGAATDVWIQASYR